MVCKRTHFQSERKYSYFCFISRAKNRRIFEKNWHKGTSSTPPHSTRSGIQEKKRGETRDNSRASPISKPKCVFYQNSTLGALLAPYSDSKYARVRNPKIPPRILFGNVRISML